MRAFADLVAVLRQVKNPLPLLLDRAHLRNRPYIARMRNGLAMELRPERGDRYSLYETVIRNVYLRQGQRLRRGDTVIDIGANIGCFSVLAARAVGPSGRVIAVEPEQSTYESLQRNLHLNGCTNVVARRLAIGGSTGDAELHVSPKALFSSFYPEVGGATAEATTHPTGRMLQTVPMSTLDQLLDDSGVERCNYLKVDCEGAEYEIFRAMQRRTAERLDQITMELHWIPGERPETLRALLAELGFQQDLVSSLLYAWR